MLKRGSINMRRGQIIRSAAAAGLFGLFLGRIATAFAQQSPNPAVDAIFADLSKPGSPGCALGVYRDGKIIHSKGYGLANIESNVPITPQTVFDVASISKQFTAASILLLDHQGKLRLDEDVRKYIPELPSMGERSPSSTCSITRAACGIIRRYSCWRV
jgi:CubicO group peptidase (beta-lactamase class C family)